MKSATRILDLIKGQVAPKQEEKKELEPLLTYEDVSRILGIAVSKVRPFVSSGKLKCRRLGHRTVRFERSQVQKFIESLPSAVPA